MSQTSPVTETAPLPARMRDFIKSGITQFKEHELREIVAVFCRLPGIAPAGHAQCSHRTEYQVGYSAGVLDQIEAEKLTCGHAQTPDLKDRRIKELELALEKTAQHIKRNHRANGGWWNDPAAWETITKVVEPVLAASPDTSTDQNMVASDPSPENIEPSPEPLA